MLTKDDIISAKKNGKVLFSKSEFSHTPGWHVFEDVYDKALKVAGEEYGWCSTLTVDNSEDFSREFDYLVSKVGSIHPGEKIAVLSIVHFLTGHDNTIPDDAVAFGSKFFENNPNKLPEDFDFGLMYASRHSDAVDGFYIQCNGNTTWRVFYEDATMEYFVEPGDMLYIPSGIEHSVESLNVRNAVSISFFD